MGGGMMSKYMKSVLLSAALIIAAGASRPANADTFTLSNSSGGDGSVVTIPGGFDLYGANNGVGSNYTYYVATALTNETLSWNWSYTTYDCCGSYWDPAGYYLNGTTTQLSTDGTVGGLYDTSGTLSLNLLTGDTYGFYVYSVDSILGPGEIAVTATPLPSTWTMLIAGFVGLGLFAYRGSTNRSAAIGAA
jgi:hypothetical protein